MRGTPTIGYNGTVGNYNVYNGSTAGAVSAISGSADSYGVILSITTVQTYSVGTGAQFYANQGNNVNFTSEL